MEMIVKLFAYTPRGYITNAWNCFDGTLVLFSIVDIMVTQTADADSGSPLKILKVFRLVSKSFILNYTRGTLRKNCGFYSKSTNLIVDQN